MYKMQLELLGFKFRVEVVILCLIVGAILGCHVFCSCVKVSAKEGMQVMGAVLNYTMGEGVANSWDTREQKKGSSANWRSQDHDSYASKMVTPNESMNFFADTQFEPKCCGSSYSANGGLTSQGVTSGGCACLNTKQMNYLNTRGGNRTLPTEF
jgi:hypothetical protein